MFHARKLWESQIGIKGKLDDLQELWIIKLNPRVILTVHIDLQDRLVNGKPGNIEVIMLKVTLTKSM